MTSNRRAAQPQVWGAITDWCTDVTVPQTSSDATTQSISLNRPGTHNASRCNDFSLADR